MCQTSLSFSRMAEVIMARVWVKFEDRHSVKITVEYGVDVHDLIESYLQKEMVAIPASLINATYEGEELRRSKPVSEI